MNAHDPDDWLRVPAARRAGEVLGHPRDDGGTDEPPPPPTETFDLLSPEHRDKLVTMFRWVSQGRRWDEVREDVLAMFNLPSR